METKGFGIGVAPSGEWLAQPAINSASSVTPIEVMGVLNTMLINAAGGLGEPQRNETPVASAIRTGHIDFQWNIESELNSS
ncbi:hypothetical protein [Pseudomonas sp. 2822-15]|uniref:hypothetical protein n=1 Tax=Pseudomonas sp. 2822-15 TaxID=1712677 RepID=UPI00117ADEA1|nr:hypothetical protein [Pseudomonas sp. 2822-15]